MPANPDSALALFLAGLQQTNHLGDASGSRFRVTFCGLDPGEVPAPVELCQRIEERPRCRLGVEGLGDVRRQVGTLRPLGCQDDGDFIAWTNPAIATPRRTENDCIARSKGLDNGAHRHSVDRAPDAMS